MIKIKYQKKFLSLAAAVCVGVFLADKIVLSPLIGIWRARSEQITIIQRQVQQGEQLIEREHTLRTRWKEMEDRSLPRDPSVTESDVLRSVDQWAQESRVSFTSIKPQWSQSEDGVSLFECRTEATGRIDQIVKFLYLLETAELPLKIEQLKISAGNDSDDRLAVSARFSGLVLQQEAATL